MMDKRLFEKKQAEMQDQARSASKPLCAPSFRATDDPSSIADKLNRVVGELNVIADEAVAALEGGQEQNLQDKLARANRGREVAIKESRRYYDEKKSIWRFTTCLKDDLRAAIALAEVADERSRKHLRARDDIGKTCRRLREDVRVLQHKFDVAQSDLDYWKHEAKVVRVNPLRGRWEG